MGKESDKLELVLEDREGVGLTEGKEPDEDSSDKLELLLEDREEVGLTEDKDLDADSSDKLELVLEDREGVGITEDNMPLSCFGPVDSEGVGFGI